MAASSSHPRVSVALGTYRSGKFLRAQLLSILNQTLPVLEVLISDDGSGDGTLELVEAVARDHPLGDRVRVVAHHRAGGVARNFARAIAECRGDVIALSDHDDVWLPHKIETLVRAITGLGLVFSDAWIIDADGHRTGGTLFGAYDIGEDELASIERGDALAVLDARNVVTGATVLVNGDLARRAMPVGTSWVHDEWLAYLAAATQGVGVVREPLIEYRVHGSNEIGVPQRTPVGEFVHGLRAGSARYKMHRDRTLALLRRLRELDATPAAIDSVYSRLAFDNARLRYPALPWRRRGHINDRARLGDYERFVLSSRSERWRDLLQRP